MSRLASGDDGPWIIQNERVKNGRFHLSDKKAFNKDDIG